MIKVTNEIREAAGRLLTKHNADEKKRVEVRYKAELAEAENAVAYYGRGAPNKPYIRKLAEHELPADKDTRKRLEAIVEGKRKLIDEKWWSEVFGSVDSSPAKRAKIAAMADPARNSNEHERNVALAKLAAAKARRPPGLRPESPPLPENIDDWVDYRKTARSKRARRPRLQNHLSAVCPIALLLHTNPIALRPLPSIRPIALQLFTYPIALQLQLSSRPTLLHPLPSLYPIALHSLNP